MNRLEEIGLNKVEEVNENKEEKRDQPSDLEGMNAKEIWVKLYNKELNTKKNILEYIDIARTLGKKGASEEQLKDSYKMIYDSIQQMGSLVKVNTKVYLMNQLKAQLGKYGREEEAKAVNQFIDFFKKAYPPQKRNKEFTYVLTDINTITDEQIWTTLTYINAWCLKDNTLNEEQKKDTIKMVELLVKRNNIKYINNLKSLERLINVLDIKIQALKGYFKVKRK